MTHVGRWASALVDGRLRPDVAERARAHLAGCAECRAAVDAERRVQRVLREAPVPAPSQELVARLLAMGGPQGPFSPPPGHVPGSPERAPVVPWAGTVARRRAARRRAVPVAVGALSLVSLVSLGLLGLLLLDGSWPRPAPGTAVAAGDGAASFWPQNAEARVDRLDASERAALRTQGWVCPEALPEGLLLVDARSLRAEGAVTLHATYSDGTSTVSLVEKRGELQPADARALTDVLTAGTSTAPGARWQGVWQSGDVVVGVLADASPRTVARVLPALLSGG